MRQRHLDLLGFAYGREVPPLEQIRGNTMVDADFMPRGFCFAWFEPDGVGRNGEAVSPVVSVHAHFGPWLRIFPKDILRGMKVTIDELRAMGVREVMAIADESVPGSETLVRWFKGVPTGQRGEFGDIYRVDLTQTPI